MALSKNAFTSTNNEHKEYTMTSGKQEAHGPHRSPEKNPVQFNKHIRLYHNINKRREEPIFYFLRIKWFFMWTKLNPLHPIMLCAFAWVWRRFFNFVNLFSIFRNYLPFEKGEVFHLNKLESSSPKYALCQVSLILA